MNQVNSVPQVVHPGTFSQNIDKQTLHTNPSAVGRLWQKHEARKSTLAGFGRRKNSREGPSTAHTVCRAQNMQRDHCQHCTKNAAKSIKQRVREAGVSPGGILRGLLPWWA